MQTTVSTSPSLIAAPSFTQTIPGRILLGLSATLVVAAAAHVSFPLWFTPVPLTLQPLAVLCVGLALGPLTAFFAMLAYLAEGAMGLPVFSPNGLGGVAQLLGPTGGFLMAYPLVAALAGGLVRIFERSVPKFAAAALAGTLSFVVLFISGAFWLAAIAHLTLHQTWVAAVGPFLPGGIVKILVAAGLYSALSRGRLQTSSPRAPRS